MSQESHFKDFLRWKDFGVWEKPTTLHQMVKGLNPLCGDEIIIYYCITEDNAIEILGLGGESCSICRAASGLLFKNKTKIQKDHFLSYLTERKNFLDGEDSLLFQDPEEISFYNILRSHPGRYRCGLLPWQTLAKLSEEKK
ncbi:iron-sulfur cluster assembly scaffold protein [Leptospira sp. 2 VSF19]|uniref:Iron-sulfur cluster assembly scaffold protein n=1 Tax=Leptospira soteropolitanensis TaxID=2950025 RepID=A0AAW5VDC8_9LEPT|nr:iron-sulfur cluster assembly scaffold protein [Leptospira soteropolitanensis]MCW7493276.1 iron-sulfur cluster assembly scaffold protein [Leptospira soteropolitanensis]MCW7500655.1 iron-sulfur cluster assembly scaffold protein [Leptospira soteropolitanensis]MCW7523126.1 iron-sulfur cluster assembly scaffold protein [Leptospira soteropolitanensis]MCW7526767.1 iron-sulfur cluster assembly scaffold protein [Leptospira soteropolitanensis]MCW7530844.1 iron-sulfur cluster assembly scaffold protein